MSLFSILRKNKQESAPDDSAFYSRAEEETKAVRNRNKRRQGGKNGRGDGPADPVLPEKKRARRRLIGAVALVLAAVIGLPMILDSEPKPMADDIAIQIPSKDKPAAASAARAASPESHVAATESLDAKEEVIEPSAAPVIARTEAVKQAEAASPAAAPVKPKDEPRHDTLARNAAEKPHPSQPVKPEVKAEPKAATKVDKADETARALALLEGKTDHIAARSESGKFVVQVAALASAEKVNELQAKLKGAGISSYTQKVATSSGDRTRIRVGPFASKEEAEKVRAKIVKMGLNGTLVPA